LKILKYPTLDVGWACGFVGLWAWARNAALKDSIGGAKLG